MERTTCPARLELLAQAQQREVLRLGLEHHVEVEAGGGVAQEVLERERVDQVGVGAELREDERALDPPADLRLRCSSTRFGRRVVDLRA